MRPTTRRATTATALPPRHRCTEVPAWPAWPATRPDPSRPPSPTTPSWAGAALRRRPTSSASWDRPRPERLPPSITRQPLGLGRLHRLQAKVAASSSFHRNPPRHPPWPRCTTAVADCQYPARRRTSSTSCSSPPASARSRPSYTRSSRGIRLRLLRVRVPQGMRRMAASPSRHRKLWMGVERSNPSWGAAAARPRGRQVRPPSRSRTTAPWSTTAKVRWRLTRPRWLRRMPPI
mmetsp:Transcript_30773/g.89889  ORF Transcript_30773/g.89889 Transcript_30773/m.89889 type:complete len:234 (-) Transcript_30773:546-1247(-)